jgi:hypothetical protein
VIEISEVLSPMSGNRSVLLQDSNNIIILREPAQREILRWFKKYKSDVWKEITDER